MIKTRKVPRNELSGVMDERMFNSNGEAFTNKSNKDEKKMNSGLKGDWGNMFVLTFLYVLQGIPLGLAGAIPMILQNQQVTYKEQAIFSFVHWPFSMKLLWAPIVDTVYISKMGKRKSWMVPTQYLIGAFMLTLSFTVDGLFGRGSDGIIVGKPNVLFITAVFFVLCFLAATQDIAVDGWALTMLKKHNVGHASTCNCIGQSAGYFVGFVLFLALESVEFCNSYLRSEPQTTGIVTLPGFLYFWGWIYFTTTTLVWIFKKENQSSIDDSETSIKDAYVSLWKIIKLPSIVLLLIFLLTMKMGFAAPDAITGLKLAERGVPKEKLAFLAIPLIPLQIILPLFISRFTAGPRPLNVLIKAYPYRLLFGFIYPMLVWTTSYMKTGPGLFPYYYYAILLLCYAAHQVAVYSIFVSIMGFFAKISDPAIGGTYMTLLNTLSNLGGNWPSTVALWFVDSLTVKECVGASASSYCDNEDAVKACESQGGSCEIVSDGYYYECIACTVMGILWLWWGKRAVSRMQAADESAWRTNHSPSSNSYVHYS